MSSSALSASAGVAAPSPTSRSSVSPASTNGSSVPASATVIIATYNRGMVLFDTIRMVMENDHPDFECIVVDQTPEPTDDYLARLADVQATYDFEYVTLPAPSLTYARNEGIRRARGEVVIFIDDDVELAPDFIDAHLAAYADPTVGAVAGRVVESKGDKVEATGQIGRLMPDGSTCANFHLSTRTECDYGRGCNMSFRTSTLHDIDGCDERYIGSFYREDGDLFARIKRLGHRVMFEPDTTVIHLESDGGSRTDRGAKNLKREHSNFHNETLFYLSCVGTDVPGFYYRLLRWMYAVKKRKGYTWPEFAYLVSGVIEATRAFYFTSAHNLTETHVGGWHR